MTAANPLSAEEYEEYVAQFEPLDKDERREAVALAGRALLERYPPRDLWRCALCYEATVRALERELNIANERIETLADAYLQARTKLETKEKP